MAKNLRLGDSAHTLYLIDVSSFKEVFREKYGVSFQKKNAHRAVDDIIESIRELRHYLSFVKIPPEPGPDQTTK